MLPRPHLLLAFLVAVPVIMAGSENQLNFKVAPPMLKTLLGGELERKFNNILSRVPNKICVAHLRALLEGIKKKEYWALSMLDASAKFPEGMFAFMLWNMGNFDQCLRIQDIRTDSGSFSGQHCNVRLCKTSGSSCVDQFHENIFRGNPVLKLTEDPYIDVSKALPLIDEIINTTSFRVAACVPSTCSSDDLEALFRGATTQLSSTIKATVKSGECYTSKPTEYSPIDIFTLSLYTLMLALVISSTVYDLTHRDPGSRNEIYITFSAYTNLRKMLTTSENSEGTLQCVHGIRFLSIFYVIVGHVYYSKPVIPCQNISDVNEFIRSSSSIWVMAGFYSVDTFFVLSGVLVGYVFLNLVAERKSMNFKVFYIHRLVRLTPALGAVLLFEMSLGKKFGDGPFWKNYFINDCEKNWWHVLFYLRNIKVYGSCMMSTWYLAVDTQLYFLSPLLLVPLWKNPRLGKQLLAIAIFFSWFLPFSYAYIGEHRIPAKPIVFLSKNIEGTARLYSGTQNRYGPWALGIWLGYFLHRIRSGQATVKFSKIQVAAMWTYIFLMGYTCVASMHPFSQMDHEYNRFVDSFYNSVIHLLWGTVVCLIILACVTGYGGPINWFLSLSVWIPWSRLTYAIYLVHYTILYVLDGQIRTPGEFQHDLLFRKCLSCLLLSTVVGAILSLMFESPITAFERILLRQVRGKGSKKLPRELDTNKRKLQLPNGEIK